MIVARTTVLPEGSIKRIHVNGANLRWNRDHPDEPRRTTSTVENWGSAFECREVVVNGPSTMVYRPDNPLKCGAVQWIETTAEVVCIPL